MMFLQVYFAVSVEDDIDVPYIAGKIQPHNIRKFAYIIRKI
jgi:hypothetical protein